MASKFGSYMGLLLPPALHDWVERQAESRGVYRSEVVRELIKREMEQTQEGVTGVGAEESQTRGSLSYG